MDALPTFPKDQANFLLSNLFKWIGGILITIGGYLFHKFQKVIESLEKRFEEHSQQLVNLKIDVAEIRTDQRAIRESLHDIKNSQAQKINFHDDLQEIKTLLTQRNDR